ncbi:DUF402 domain-containing protein [Salinicoccus sp. HZC-1]|uniref:DUF402 domain-containing protein n=1 Tax=Salinicoccus sp. HZC-1 TaxID=3385497 RepID=UPI00398AE4E0
MKTKYLDKRGWRRLLQSNYHEKIIQYQGEEILTGIIEIIKVRSPLTVPILNQEVLVCDDGFRWLQILPKNRNYSITVMYDDQWQAVQYYFDINIKHFLELKNARRVDVYLDVLALPDGRYELVDEFDIKRARSRREVSREQYDFAYSAANDVMAELERDFSQFERMASHCLKQLDMKN